MGQDELYLEIGLGTRLRRVMERLQPDADRFYTDAGVPFKAAYFYVVYALDQRGAMPIGDIAKAAGFSHSAVSQTVKKLVKEGIVETLATEDGRQKLVGLTNAGEVLVGKLRPLWAALETALKGAILESGENLLSAITGFEESLTARPLYARATEALQAGAPAPFDLVPYDVQYRRAFYDLNAFWLEKWFVIEPIDEKVLSDPDTYILEKGGEIFFAVQGGKALGTVALKPEADGRFELTKLGVDESVQKGGMGRALCEKVIERFKARGGRLLFLETSTKLKPAIKLYERLNFLAMEPPTPSPYARADYYMEWQGE